MIYLITYDLKETENRDYSPLYNVIKSIGKSWWHYLQSTWIISTSNELNVNIITDLIRTQMKNGDRLLVVKIDNQERQGWLPKEAWEWIKKEESAKPEDTHK